MTQLHLLAVNEREAFFDVTAQALNIFLKLLKKDYWVVWILERLFSLPDLKII